MSANSELSVISTTSRSAGKAGLGEHPHDPLGEPAVGELDGEMLTEILIAGSHAAASRSASPMTCSDRRPISADLLGDRDEDVGPITPDSGWFQRASTSKPTISPVARSTCGSKIGNELAVLEAEADALLDLALGDQRALHAGVEPDRPRDAAAACAWSIAMSARRRRSGMRDFACRSRGDAGEGADLDDPLVEQRTAG